MANRFVPLSFMVTAVLSCCEAADAAEVIFHEANPKCTLRKSVNGAWVPANPEELRGLSLATPQPASRDGKKVAVKVNNAWYGGDAFCFVDPSTTNLPPAVASEEAKLAADQNVAAPPSRATRSTVAGSYSGFFAELTAGYALIAGDFGKGSTTTTDSGLIITSGDAGVSLDLGARIGYAFGGGHALFLRGTRIAFNQKVEYSGGATGAAEVDLKQIQMGIGYAYSFTDTGSFRPYFAQTIGTSSLSDTTKITDFSGANESLNGTIESSGSGLYLSPELGAEFYFGSVSVVPSLRYDLTKIKTLKAKSSTSSGAAAGDEVALEKNEKYSGVILSVGLRYNF